MKNQLSLLAASLILGLSIISEDQVMNLMKKEESIAVLKGLVERRDTTYQYSIGGYIRGENRHYF